MSMHHIIYMGITLLNGISICDNLPYKFDENAPFFKGKIVAGEEKYIFLEMFEKCFFGDWRNRDE